MQNVTIKAEIADVNGDKFAELTVSYFNVPRAGVLAIEEQLIGMQSGLLAVAKEVEAGK